MTPVGWWHDLQGGEIAATRPPPPGADLPYPKLGTTPPKPVLPSNSFRDTVRDQLTNQRDDTERLAARNPIEILPPPPVPRPAAAAANADTPNATLPGADAPQAKPAAPAALLTASSESGSGGATPPATGVVLAGAPADATGLPPIPDAPPPPATFEGVAPVPAPTPAPPLPAHVPRAFSGSPVLFATGSAVLDSSQTETLKDATARRGRGHIDIQGHGDAAGDSPQAQQAALELAITRAKAIADSLVKAQHVPASAIRLSATAFGRGASLSVAP